MRTSVPQICRDEGESRLLGNVREEFVAKDEIPLPDIDGSIPRGIIRLDENIDFLDIFPSLCFAFRELEEEEVPRVEDEDVLSFRSQSLDQCGFLGEPAKGILVSATGLDLPLDIVGVDDGEVMFCVGLLGEETPNYTEDKQGDDEEYEKLHPHGLRSM